MNQDLDDCQHSDFEAGKCLICSWVCEHDEVDEGICLVCGMQVIDDREAPDMDFPDIDIPLS